MEADFTLAKVRDMLGDGVATHHQQPHKKRDDLQHDGLHGLEYDFTHADTTTSDAPLDFENAFNYWYDANMHDTFNGLRGDETLRKP